MRCYFAFCDRGVFFSCNTSSWFAKYFCQMEIHSCSTELRHVHEWVHIDFLSFKCNLDLWDRGMVLSCNTPSWYGKRLCKIPLKSYSRTTSRTWMVGCILTFKLPWYAKHFYQVIWKSIHAEQRHKKPWCTDRQTDFTLFQVLALFQLFFSLRAIRKKSFVSYCSCIYCTIN